MLLLSGLERMERRVLCRFGGSRKSEGAFFFLPPPSLLPLPLLVCKVKLDRNVH
jgi:hypothetical protein